MLNLYERLLRILASDNNNKLPLFGVFRQLRLAVVVSSPNKTGTNFRRKYSSISQKSLYLLGQEWDRVVGLSNRNSSPFFMTNSNNFTCFRPKDIRYQNKTRSRLLSYHGQKVDYKKNLSISIKIHLYYLTITQRIQTLNN